MTTRVSRALDLLRSDPRLLARLVRRRFFGPPDPSDVGLSVCIGGVTLPLAPSITRDENFGGYLAEIAQLSYEPTTRRTIERTLRPGDLFFDVGANIGYFSAIASSVMGPTGTVVAFEFDPRCLQNLEALQASNPDHDIRIRNAAIGARREQLEVAIRETCTWNSLHADVGGAAEGRTVRVDVVTLTDAIDEVGRMPQLVKIDVEGAEADAIAGLIPALERSETRPPIILEIDKNRPDTEGTLERLGELGYRLRSVIPPHHQVRLDDLPPIGNVFLSP